MDRHLDLVRNDWGKEVQDRVARVWIGEPDTTGFIVKQDNGGDWEAQIRDALSISMNADEITAALVTKFSGPYLFVVGPHLDDACPFDRGAVPMERSPAGEAGFRLQSR